LEATVGVEGFFLSGATREFFQIFSTGAKSGKMCFFPLKTKKNNLFAKYELYRKGAPHCLYPTVP